MTADPDTRLRRGWTTGACAAAAARAAYAALLTGAFPDPVTIRLPGGEAPSFPLALKERDGDCARAGVVKDAGDDPDVTNGALVIAEVRAAVAGAGIRFFAGPGVGTVSLPGLPLGVGEPAINPGPRAMIAAALAAVRASPDAEVTLSIPGGEALAAQTMNGRLGIRGGLSILGTSGIVIPYSCAAWIASIHRGVDVARALGLGHIAGATGRGSEAAVQLLYALPETALIDMGDFAGGLLKYLRRHPVPRLTLAGGFGKMAKLAEGHLDLHSSQSRIEGAALARRLERLAAPAAAIDAVRASASAGQALTLLAASWPALAAALAESVAAGAREVALATLAGGVAVDVAIFDREGELLGHAGG
ncbi:MAG TPA: cobalt-precorrin-5B (C(1))-methyltransferase [Stellaceae bacterium]|nr:cobalt-precorrin-5B (C(1))-methyltransferase [Stellaceae bacterium]